MLSQRAAQEEQDLDTSKIKEWRSIVTLIVFVMTNINVLFPFHIPIYVPRFLWTAVICSLKKLRIISPLGDYSRTRNGQSSAFVLFRFPINFITAPLVADLFLLAIQAIGRKEVHDGTIGAQNIAPYDIMLFFISLAYIAISVDASGLIRWLAFKVLQRGGKVGHRLFFYLYAFFFALTAFVGNDPVILSGTAFLSYMTRVSSNIKHPRAWIYTQFSVANIASTILVSSNPTNLVLAGAFRITFIKYSANVIVPVVVTGIVLFPFLLYILFRDESLIPSTIKMEDLPDEIKNKKPVNPNIPYAKGELEEQGDEDVKSKQSSLEEILNPFLDKKSAIFGAVVMAATLITVLALNASSQGEHKLHVFWVTLPASVILFLWDLAHGWANRDETRKIAREGRQRLELAQSAARAEAARKCGIIQEDSDATASNFNNHGAVDASNEKLPPPSIPIPTSSSRIPGQNDASEEEKQDTHREKEAASLASLIADRYTWCHETFPTTITVLNHLPLALIPFAFCMFILVQALVTKGWVPVFAHGWDHWVEKTGTVGAIGGMGFLSVVLCNFAGTNIGTAILLARTLQAWQQIHLQSGLPISNRTFWGTVYSMAIGLNYGAFSLAFSASLAGMLWRDILARKHIHVGGLEFARVNLPIIAVTMVVGMAVLVGQIYVTRDAGPYNGV